MTHPKKKLSTEERAFYNALGARIAQQREEMKLTQIQVAAALRIAQQTYAGYEVGNRRFPVFLLHTLAEVLGTDVNFLLGIPARNAPSKRGTSRR